MIAVEKDDEKRKFPRIPADCPVLFRSQSNHQWNLARMMDFSATGLSLIFANASKEGVTIEFQIQPGDNKLVPEITGYAKILRCIPMDNNEFHISCRLTKVNMSKTAKP